MKSQPPNRSCRPVILARVAELHCQKAQCLGGKGLLEEQNENRTKGQQKPITGNLADFKLLCMLLVKNIF